MFLQVRPMEHLSQNCLSNWYRCFLGNEHSRLYMASEAVKLNSSYCREFDNMDQFSLFNQKFDIQEFIPEIQKILSEALFVVESNIQNILQQSTD